VILDRLVLPAHLEQPGQRVPTVQYQDQLGLQVPKVFKDQLEQLVLKDPKVFKEFPELLVRQVRLCMFLILRRLVRHSMRCGGKAILVSSMLTTTMEILLSGLVLHHNLILHLEFNVDLLAVSY